MISDERIQQLAADAGLPLGVRDQHETSLSLLARAIEREAIAEPVRLMRALIDALHNLDSGQLASAHQDIRDYLERMK